MRDHRAVEVAMVPHAAFTVHEPSQVGAVRRHAAKLSLQHGFDEVSAGRLALVVTELGNNLVRHARDGQLLLAALQQGDQACIEVVSLDRGPGMADVHRCLRDGYSTGGTSGGGLGAVRRMSSEFDIYSRAEGCTIVLGRVAAHSTSTQHAMPAGAAARAAPRLEVGGVCVAAPGESVSGDSWASVNHAHQGRLIVADGLGHGPEAAKAADAAIAVFNEQQGAAETHILSKAHEALRSTRGAAVAIASYDADQAQASLWGAGNIAGRLISPTSDKSLATQHGTVGLQMHRMQPMQVAWPQHSVLILHSDGVATRWSLKDEPGLLRCSAVLIAAWIIHMHSRGRDDATVVVVRRL